LDDVVVVVVVVAAGAAGGVVAAARAARANGATRFCMGAAWRGPKQRELDRVLGMVKAVRELGMETCATLGMLKEGQAEQLKEAGLDYYNHNLDTAPEFYGNIISTRTQDDRHDTLDKVRADKLREVTDGCDGTWVAHPGLVPIAKEVFDQHMPGPNQYDKQRPDVSVTSRELLDFQPSAPITEAGLRNNISVGIQYLGAWLAGNGCVPVFNLMEDAATAEISRSQIWQWIRSDKGRLDDGRKVTIELFRQLLAEELPKVKTYLGDKGWRTGKYEEAAKLFDRITTGEYVEFLTLPAYEAID